MSQVAYLGLGIMGSAMAANLARAGHHVTAWNRTPGRPGAAIAAEAGAVIANSLSEAVLEVDFVFTCLSDVPDVEQVLVGPEGVSTHAKPGTIVVDTSTTGPNAARKLSAELACAGLKFLDAPVTGGDVGARAGTLAIMVGGDADDLEKCRPLLEAVGKSVTHCGPAGSGQSVKLCNQVLCAVNMLSVSEAFVLADQLAVDRKLILDVCSQGAGGSWALSNLGQRIVNHDFAPAFMIKHILKDLRLVDESVPAMGDLLPATALCEELFESVSRQDRGAGGELGTQAMILVYPSKHSNG